MLTFLLWTVALVVAGLLAVAAYFVLLTRRLAAKAEDAIPMTGKVVQIDGDAIRYVEAGEGRPILFVHGLGGQLHHFDNPLFPALGDGFRLIALDRAGSGYSTRRTSGPRLTEQADLIARVIAELRLEKPLVVGHSLGGAISLTLALRHPGKVAGLALIAPLTHYVATPPEAFGGLYIGSPLMRGLVAETVAIPTSLKHAKATLDLVFGPQKPTEGYAYAGGGYLGLRPSHFYAVSSDLVAVERDLPDIETRYGELKMPVGILFGDADRILDHKTQGLAMQGRIDGIEIEILEGIGHMPQFIVADRVAAFVRRMAARAFAPPA